uniref:Putative acetyltransferase n=1 Tax=viral metagenome TaxID=1070528 RepID=A0A6H1ZDL6_9ZZZZ
MIYVTSHDKAEDIGKLLKEWTGKDYNSDYVMTNVYFVLARDDDKDIGCATLIGIADPFFNRSWGLVENVYVTPEYRGQGVASKIMHHAERVALGLGISLIKLTSRKEGGKALYRSLGYDESSCFRKDIKAEYVSQDECIKWLK